MSRFFGIILIIKWILMFSDLSFGHKLIPKIKVCVIGAGPAGIVTTRHLAENLDKFEITVFERSYEVGGNWLYTDETGIDKYGYPVHSSIYKNLKTNIPKELMSFPDWPEYKNVNKSIVPHYTVLEYLKNYSDHFKLKKFIEFNTIVKNVTLHKVKNLDKWRVVMKNLKTAKTTALIFDAVIVCNGHSSPNIPKITGLEHFKGTVLHSHDYRKPEYFKNKRVILLGAGPSGMDIGQDLKKFASIVYLSHNQKQNLPVRLIQIKGIDKFSNGKFILKDNSTIIADVLIFCTGYVYKYPFLDSSIRMKIDRDSISPIYKGVVHVEHPTLSFVGINPGLEGLPRFFVQAQYITSFLRGSHNLPPKKIMLEESKFKTIVRSQIESFLDSWNYSHELAQLGGFAPIPEYYRAGIKVWFTFMKNNIFEDYRNYNLVISNDKMSIKIVRN